MVPSSRGRQNNTICFEYEWRSRRDGSPAFVEARSGNVRINLDDYVTFGHRIYLFAPAEYVDTGSPDIIPVDPGELLHFVVGGLTYLPAPALLWLENLDMQIVARPRD
jgi:hypothetical protein